MTIDVSLTIALGLLLVVIQLDVSTCLLRASSFPVRQAAASTKGWIVPPLTPLPNGSTNRVSSTQLSVSLTPNQLDVTRSFENVDSAQGSRRSPGEANNFLVDNGKSAINLPLLRSVCSSQVFMLVVAVSLFAALGGDHHTLPSLELPSTGPALEFIASSVLASFTLSLILCFYEWTSHSSYRPASQINVATSHLVFDLFGRRHRRIHQSATRDEGSSFSASTTGDMFATILVIGLVSVITAVCQELSFRGFFYEMVSQQLSILGPIPSVTASAVIGQAAMYAALTTPSTDASTGKLDLLTFAFKFMTGLLLGLLAETSHTLLPCVAIQFLSTWHALAKSWINVNHHMDWVEQQALPAVSYEQATVRIPNDTRRSLFRFFCAFDSEEHQSLSLSDVQRAVSFAFWHSEDPPSQEEVRQTVLSQEGSRYVDHQHRPDDDGSESVRLNFDAFVSVLVALRRRTA